jgi:predicted  nucleic acid-binding Zn-ribbon protein
MCTVANLIRACCFEGLAYSLVTSLGPERFTEWKTALINEAAGKLPRLFGTLERDVRNGKFEPGAGALQYGHATPGYDINELIDKDMTELRKTLKDLRRAELIAAKEHDRVRAAARDVASAQAQSTSDTQDRRTSGADQLRHRSVEIVAAGEYEQEADEMSDTEAMVT